MNMVIILSIYNMLEVPASFLAFRFSSLPQNCWWRSWSMMLMSHEISTIKDSPFSLLQNSRSSALLLLIYTAKADITVSMLSAPHIPVQVLWQTSQYCFIDLESLYISLNILCIILFHEDLHCISMRRN